MANVTYIQSNGSVTTVEVDDGKTVMQGAVDNMIDGIDAECGGACACATCHCYVDESWTVKVGAANDMEEELLDGVSSSNNNSRLSCQIEINDELDGLVVHLPEQQY